MSEVKPFKAVRYNKDKVNDLSAVVCPPYDVISLQQQNDFYNFSEYNFIRLVLGKEKSSDDRQNNVYSRAKKTYEDWLKNGILVEDEEPSLYFYKQEYKMLGQKHSRVGFIGLMKIQDDKGSRIYPHENTHTAAKEDRFKLWKALDSNLSPIFVCYSDKDRKSDKAFKKLSSSGKPLFNITDKSGVKHSVWKLSDPEQIKEITQSMTQSSLFIADGHHRYEVSKQLRRSKLDHMNKKATGREPFNYVMTYFTNMDSRDLKIFPIHRVVKNFPQDLEFLNEYLRMDKVKTKEELVILLAKAGQNEHAFGLYTRGGIKLLRLKNRLLINKLINEGSKEFKSLDATILKHFVFDQLDVKSEDIIYNNDVNEATGMVDAGQADACFILNPVRIQQLKAIALNGERMPPKTTYFYPKVLSGLTVHKMG